MSEQTFKSPNFFEREIDLSAPAPTGPVGVPAGIVGTSNKGPAFVPVTVANFNEFIEKFGNLDSKHFGVYAANEFLKNRTALTYLRVLGAGANTTSQHVDDTRVKGIVKNAGFVLSASTFSTSGRPTGVVHFLVANHEVGTNEQYGMPLFTDNDTMKDPAKINLIRAAIMVPDGARIMVTGSSDPLSGIESMPADATIGPDGKFKLIISSSTGASFGTSDGFSGLRVLTASFDPSDKDYFAKVLNRDPDKFVSEQHYLHGDFAVDPTVAYVNSGKKIAVVVGSKDLSSVNDSTRSLREVFGSYDTRFTSPKTSFFFSQPFGKTEYDLFRFEAIDDGEYANTLYKISISNVKASLNNANKYGTFNVQIRNWGDVDTAPEVIEQFTNCSLDPNSENYVAKLIGDRKVFYNFDVIDPTEKRLIATGKYPNVSKYVRIVMNEAVEKGIVPPTALPFGFHGPEHLNVNTLLDNSAVLTSANSRLSGSFSTSAASVLSSSFMPPVPHRYKVTRGETGTAWAGAPGKNEQANPAYYWGVKFERSSISSVPSDTSLLNSNIINEKNACLESLTKFQGIEKLDALVTGSNKDVLNNNKFTLAKVAFGNAAISDLTSSVGKHMREAAYIRNAVIDNTDYRYNDPIVGERITFATLLASGTASEFNRFSAYAKFTNFMYGGFDGTNFLNRDARRLNDKSVSFDDGTGGGASTSNDIGGFVSNPSGKGIENNGVVSYLTAVDIMTDPMAASNNLLAIPGIKEPYINDNAMIKVRDYGLSMLVSDIPAYNDENVRLYDDSTDKINVKNTANAFDDRGIDNNYAATYFPSIYIDDAVNRRKVKVPASVAALGALGFNDRVSYPWFAPAGFNRAALDFVTNVDVRLNVSDRDRLYESRINPIATFPRLGFVIYGQKTLQVNKSALDRVNVRRLMLEIKRIIIGIAQRIVFEQNTPAVRNKFVADASFQLGLVQVQAGIEAFQVIMNESNNTQEDVDLNRLNGRIVVVPTRVVEFIAIDFIITNSGVQFV